MFRLAKPIFPKGKEKQMNTFAVFRATLESTEGVELHITAATFYQVRVNGNFVAFGPARTALGYAREDILNLSGYLEEKRNKYELQIFVAGYACRSLSTVYQDSFLTAEAVKDGKVLCCTGRDFEAYLPQWKFSKTERYSAQRHFTEIWNAGQFGRLDAADLCETEISKHPPVILSRTAPEPFYGLKFCACARGRGSLRYDPSLPYRRNFYSHEISKRLGRFENDEIADRPFEWLQRNRQIPSAGNLSLPLRLRENEYAIFDFSQIYTGFFRVEGDMRSKSKIVIGFSEDASPPQFRFTDMHVHNVIELMTDTDCTLNWDSFEPYAARYAIIAVETGNIFIKSFGIRRYEHSTDDAFIPEIKSPALLQLYKGALRTFAHNAVDLFTDCPSRERAGWLCDSYFTAKAEYALFGNTKVEDAFLENYRLYRNNGDYPDGVLPMCYPSDATDDKKFIPQWIMWYVLELDEYLSVRNPNAAGEPFFDGVRGLLRFFEKYENGDGLLECLPSWNFIEWSRANNWTYDVNYPTNFLYARMLECASRILGDPALTNKAEHVRKTSIEQSFDGRVFLDHAVRNSGVLTRMSDCSETCQYYAVLFGNIDFEDERFRILKHLITDCFGAVRREGLRETGIEEINAFIGVYLRLEVLLKMKRKDLILRDIDDFFGHMVKETGTLWEYRQRHGSRDHGFASYLAAVIKEICKDGEQNS